MRIDLSPDPESVVEIELRDGTKLQQSVERISFTPFFASKSAQGRLAKLQATVGTGENAQEVDGIQLSISGKTGKLTVYRHAGGAVPEIEAQLRGQGQS